MDNTANYQNNTQNFKFCRKCGRKLLYKSEMHYKWVFSVSYGIITDTLYRPC